MKEVNAIPGSINSITQNIAKKGLSLQTSSSYKVHANQSSNLKHVTDSSTYIRYLKTASSFRK